MAIFCAIQMVRARVPQEILDIWLGQSVDAVRQAIPWLAWDSKDFNHTWLSGTASQSRLGVKYRWVFSVDLDHAGRVIHIDGRSYNEFMGLLDRKYNLANPNKSVVASANSVPISSPN